MNIMIKADGKQFFASIVTPQEEVIRRHPDALETHDGRFRYNPFVYDPFRDPHMSDARTLAKVSLSLRVKSDTPRIWVDYLAKDLEMPTGRNAVGGPLTPHNSSKPARMLLCASLMVARCKVLRYMKLDPAKLQDWKAPTIRVGLYAAGDSDLVSYYNKTLGLVPKGIGMEGTQMEGSLNDALQLCRMASALPPSLSPLLNLPYVITTAVE